MTIKEEKKAKVTEILKSLETIKNLLMMEYDEIKKQIDKSEEGSIESEALQLRADDISNYLKACNAFIIDLHLYYNSL